MYFLCYIFKRQITIIFINSFFRIHKFNLMQRIHNFFKFSKKIRIYVQSEINPEIKLTIDATEGEILAKELKRHKVPLPFECGFSCSCSTCSVLLTNSNDFNKIQIA